MAIRKLAQEMGFVRISDSERTVAGPTCCLCGEDADCRIFVGTFSREFCEKHAVDALLDALTTAVGQELVG